VEPQDRTLADRVEGYGEPMPPRSSPSPPSYGVRSKAWVYYTVFAAASFIVLCTGKPVGLAGMVLFGLYARYLYRGGRIVFWFW
jgi:hypothetical protein